jgi:uncharacterized protein YndB with AHSA1/START domain
MTRLEFSLEIERPIDEVFAYVADPANLPEWQSSAIEARMETAAPMAAGTRFVEVRKFLGRQIKSTVEVTQYDPSRRFAIRTVAGPVTFRVDHVFEPLAGATRLAVSGEGESGRLFKTGEALMIRAAERQMKGDFQRLKRILEGGR